VSDHRGIQTNEETTEDAENAETEDAMWPRQLVHEELTGVVRQTAFETHVYFGKGFLEKVYENALVNRLRKKGLAVAQQKSLKVQDEDGSVVGDYVADLVVNDRVLIEDKAATSLADEHVAQVLNYLKATGIQVGLLVNFGAPRLDFRRLVLERDPSASSASSAVPFPSRQ
jgi:GxxExxY protein